ncbi:hypothetical protein PUN28_009191 [Cardiocondyla obscurior]|uniref:Uncharacterized protein n=1 Tax=Cardiocondyla obscurior TaxID=286306 RepID=A0AAW2FSC7_9HYME
MYIYEIYRYIYIAVRLLKYFASGSGFFGVGGDGDAPQKITKPKFQAVYSAKSRPRRPLKISPEERKREEGARGRDENAGVTVLFLITPRDEARESGRGRKSGTVGRAGAEGGQGDGEKRRPACHYVTR